MDCRQHHKLPAASTQAALTRLLCCTGPRSTKQNLWQRVQHVPAELGDCILAAQTAIRAQPAECETGEEQGGWRERSDAPLAGGRRRRWRRWQQVTAADIGCAIGLETT